jgi:magnesium transporter
VIERFDPEARTLGPAKEIPAKGWVHLAAPSEDELALVLARGLSGSLVGHALDVDEVARVDTDGETTLIVVRAPSRRGDTQPLSILVLGELVVTVAKTSTEVVSHLCRRDRLEPSRPLRFALELVAHVAEEFLREVRRIDRAVDELEQKLSASLENKEVMALLGHQKALVHYKTALGSNQIMLERLGKLPHLTLADDERELLDDVEVEVRQSTEMANVSFDILSQTMDAFASIISNNLNVVMKILTSVTLVLTGPLLLVSIWGMNVELPLQKQPWAFAALMAGAAVIAALVALLFWRKRWL